MSKPKLVILSTANWDAAVWTNKQHLASRLAVYFDVTYIESLGLRAPSARWNDVRRVLRAVLPSKFGPREPRSRPTGLSVLSPKVVPFHRFGIVRLLNLAIFRRQTRHLASSFTLWTFSPLTYGLDERATTVHYHAVDLLHTFDRVPRDLVLDLERRLVSRGAKGYASSLVVKAHLVEQGWNDVVLLENVADIQLFAAARQLASSRDGVVFAGNLTESKVDYRLLELIAAAGISLTLAGPTGIDGSRGSSALDSILHYPNVDYVGVQSQDELAHTFSRARVGIIPYIKNEHTAGIFPMKIFEYAASGLAVVTTDLASIENLSRPWLLKAKTSSEFLSQLQQMLVAPQQAAIQELTAHSWDMRVRRIREFIDG